MTSICFLIEINIDSKMGDVVVLSLLVLCTLALHVAFLASHTPDGRQNVV